MEKKLEKVLLFVREQPEEDEDFVRIRDVEFKKHNIEIVEINIRDYHSNEIAKELYRYGKEKNILAFIEKIDTLPDMLGSGLSKNIRFYCATRSYDEFINKYGSYVINLVI